MVLALKVTSPVGLTNCSFDLQPKKIANEKGGKLFFSCDGIYLENK
jgi:hypothetical protein